MKKKNSLLKIILIPIFLAGVFFRLYQLGQNPPSLNWDEVSHGVNAYLIAHTGHDEWGEFMPSIFRAYGDYKLPAYIYLTAAVVKIIGLSEISVRLVSVIAGFVTVLGMGLLISRVFNLKKNEAVTYGILAIGITAILPWHVFLSRVALEANLSLAFITYSLWGILGTSKKEKIFGWMMLGFALNTYNSARVASAALVVFYLLRDVFDKRLFKDLFAKSIFVILTIPMLWQIFTGSALARYDKLSLWTDIDRYSVELSRNNSNLPPIVEKVLYNKYTYIASRIAKNYISYFSLSFWLQTDNPQVQFAIPGMPLWGLSVMSTFAFGVIYLTKKQRLFLLLAILVFMLPAALTNSPAQALRPLYLIVPISLVSAYGLGRIYIKNSYLALILLVVMFIESSVYFYTYTNTYPKKYSDSWQYGYKQMVESVKSKSSQREVIITKKLGEPHTFAAMYRLYEPEKLTDDKNIRFKQSGWYWTDKVGSVYFANDWLMLPNSNEVKLESGEIVSYKGKIIVSGENNAPIAAKVLDKIMDESGKVVFVVSLYE